MMYWFPSISAVVVPVSADTYISLPAWSIEQQISQIQTAKPPCTGESVYFCINALFCFFFKLYYFDINSRIFFFELSTGTPPACAKCWQQQRCCSGCNITIALPFSQKQQQKLILKDFLYFFFFGQLNKLRYYW